MFLYQSRFLRRGEVWFDNEPTTAPVDWILYRNRSNPVAGAKWRYFYNRLIDLSKDAQALLAEMEPRTAAKIETARERDHISCQCCDLSDGTTFQEIEQIWNESIESKKRWGPLNRLWLNEMISANAFELDVARDASGAPLIYIGLFREKTRVQQLMTVSPPRVTLCPSSRAKTNRASCFLLWSTMLRLKQEGVRYFDFGGWYPGNDDVQLLGANAFKRGFGGQVVREFECEQIVTVKGWTLLTAARMIARARQFRFRPILEGKTKQPLPPPAIQPLQPKAG